MSSASGAPNSAGAPTQLAFETVEERIAAVPALPTLVLELLLDLDNEDLRLSELSRRIARDPSLSARLLKVANSSFYGVSGQVSTVNGAIAVLGINTVRSLIATSTLIANLPTPALGSLDVVAFWKHAVATAIGARALAQQVGLESDQAYTAGLLHDIGRLLMATQFPAQFCAAQAQRSANPRNPMEAEDAALGVAHAHVGEALARHWRFPSVLQNAISSHHTPAPGDRLSQVLHLADLLAHTLEHLGPDGDLLSALEPSAWQALGLDEVRMLQLAERVEHELGGATLFLQSH